MNKANMDYYKRWIISLTRVQTTEGR